MEFNEAKQDMEQQKFTLEQRIMELEVRARSGVWLHVQGHGCLACTHQDV
jgi:hypothetical protein